MGIQEASEGDWFCSPECKTHGIHLLYAKQEKGREDEDMLKCAEGWLPLVHSHPPALEQTKRLFRLTLQIYQRCEIKISFSVTISKLCSNVLLCPLRFWTKVWTVRVLEGTMLLISNLFNFLYLSAASVWYCSDQCHLGGRGDQQHSLFLVWQGLSPGQPGCCAWRTALQSLPGRGSTSLNFEMAM